MPPDTLRIDKWLWYTRFFKTRSLAADAVRGGHVRLNGQRVKAARDIAPGDALTIVKRDLQFDVEVLGLPARRGPATEAAQCYRESEESVARREAARAARREQLPPPTLHRPDKRTRRLLRERQRGEN